MKTEVVIASPPDRELLVAEIFFLSEQFAEINQEGTELEIEIYPRRDGSPWTLTYFEVMTALEKARVRLQGSSP